MRPGSKSEPASEPRELGRRVRVRNQRRVDRATDEEEPCDALVDAHGARFLRPKAGKTPPVPAHRIANPNGCVLDIGVRGGRVVGVRGREADHVNQLTTRITARAKAVVVG